MNETPSYTLRGHVLTAPKAVPGLYLVSTPIGNLGDISIRALETLAGCDVIACEDTRTSGVLLSRYGIDRPKISYNEHNAVSRGPDILRQIGEGKSIALISDAGTPLVSDPGFRLVENAVEQGIAVIPIPGASAPLAALVGSGLETGDFRFCGFLPTKHQAKAAHLKSLAEETATLIFFDGPTRVVSTLGTMAEIFGSDRKIVVARELTKMHETFHRGTALELEQEFSEMERVRGEIVIVVSPGTVAETTQEDVTALLRAALTTMRTKEAAKAVALQTGLSKQDLYQQALVLKDE